MRKTLYICVTRWNIAKEDTKNGILPSDPLGIIKEYGIYLSQNKLSPNDVIKYLKAIYTYLDSERGQTYGRYVKPEN